MFSSLLSAYSRYRLRYPVYVFHHIPKCGGTSARRVLDDWFHVYDDYYEGENKEEIKPVNLKYLNSEKCLCGHFGHDGFMLNQRYPMIFGAFRSRNRYRVFSFLRDPLEMRCSLFRHQINERVVVGDTLAENIMTYDNYYARIMDLKEENYKKKLDRYFFIGIQEDLQSSFDILASLINKPKVTLPFINTSSQGIAHSPNILSDHEIIQFKKKNQLDYKIYDYVQKNIRSKFHNG